MSKEQSDKRDAYDSSVSLRMRDGCLWLDWREGMLNLTHLVGRPDWHGRRDMSKIMEQLAETPLSHERENDGSDRRRRNIGHEPERRVTNGSVRDASVASATACSADTARLDWLQSQLKKGWGDGFAMHPLDGGALYPRPWRKALESVDYMAPDLKTGAYLWQPDVRTAIDEAMRRADGGKQTDG